MFSKDSNRLGEITPLEEMIIFGDSAESSAELCYLMTLLYIKLMDVENFGDLSSAYLHMIVNKAVSDGKDILRGFKDGNGRKN